MEKWKKAFLGIKTLLRQPALINRVLDHDDRWWEKVAKSYPQKTLPVVNFTDVCGSSTLQLDTLTFLGGGSMPTDLLLLKYLSQQIENCLYFEIGTWRGESVINVANTGAECYTLNLSNAEIVELTGDQRYADLHGYLSKGETNIHHLLGNSRDFDFSQFGQKFDLIFIDGDHRYDFVKHDTAQVFQHLVHEHSIVVWHDYAYHPEKLRPEVLAGILAGTPAALHQHLYQVSNSMCAIFSKKAWPTQDFTTPARPEHLFKISLEARTQRKGH